MEEEREHIENSPFDIYDEEIESPARENINFSPDRKKALAKEKVTPVSKVGPSPTKNAGNGVSTTLTKQKSRTLLRQATQPKPLANLPVREYREPEFVIDQDVVYRISADKVIPQWYLLKELETLKIGQDRGIGSQNSQVKNQKVTYITATYFLLVKRKELEEIQRRGTDERSSNGGNDHQL